MIDFALVLVLLVAIVVADRGPGTSADPFRA